MSRFSDGVKSDTDRFCFLLPKKTKSHFLPLQKENNIGKVSEEREIPATSLGCLLELTEAASLLEQPWRGASLSCTVTNVDWLEKRQRAGRRWVVLCNFSKDFSFFVLN